jgi:hypothetical protein
MATFDDVRRIGLEWPGVAEGTSYGTPALKVRGRGFCRLWSEREHERDGVHGTEVLVVFCELEEKELLVESSHGVLFSTPHYDGYGAVLVRLADVDLDELAELLEDSFRHKAPAALVRRLDEQTTPDE